MKYILSLSLLVVCITHLSQAEESKDVSKANTTLSVGDLNIAHAKGENCYDQDHVYKLCIDQKQLFEIAKTKAKSLNKDLLIVYGYDNCPWCRSMHNLFYFSDQSQKFQNSFVIRTIAQSTGNDTGSHLIENIRSANGVSEEYGLPYLIVIDGQTGKAKNFIDTDSLEQNSSLWRGHNLEKLMNRVFKSK